MTVTPDLSFRRIEEHEMELVAALAVAEAGREDPRSVNFGIAGASLPFHGEEVWGLFIRGGVAGAAWLRPAPGGKAAVAALVLAPVWWNTGLASWMLSGLAHAVDLSGGTGLTVTLGHGTPALGEALADAGFIGPDPEADGYPVGEWRRGGGVQPGDAFAAAHG